MRSQNRSGLISFMSNEDLREVLLLCTEGELASIAFACAAVYGEVSGFAAERNRIPIDPTTALVHYAITCPASSSEIAIEEIKLGSEIFPTIIDFTFPARSISIGGMDVWQSSRSDMPIYTSTRNKLRAKIKFLPVEEAS